MLFNSFEFLLFFPIAAAIYFLLPFKARWVWLIAASYFFYGYLKPEYGFILFGSTIISYFSGLLIGGEKAKEKASPKNGFQNRAKLILAVGLTLNLSLLFIFKYFVYLNESLKFFFDQMHLGGSMPILHVLLPVGLSFYTLQAMAYQIDVYKGKISSEKHFGIYAAFASFFPQLLAGPIARAETLLPQFREKHSLKYENLRAGCQQILLGFFKKLVVADRIAPMVNHIYNNPTSYTGIPLILSTLLFSVQIYCDFSAYSDIALGTAKIMGFDLMQNFNKPYFSKSISEFWRRWHISLSSWLRDYVYIPLGGNRVVKWHYYLNLFLTFLASGIWHGVGWTFLLWGILHGFYVVIGAIKKSITSTSNNPTFLKSPLQILITFSLVSFAWIFFRANSVSDAFYIITNLFSNLRSVSTSTLFLGQTKNFFLITLLAILITIVARCFVSSKNLILRWGTYLVLSLSIALFSSTETFRFIYMQF